MSKDKYPSIFSPQMEALVFIIRQIFFATRAVLKIGEYSRMFPSIRSRDALKPIASERKDLMDYNVGYHVSDSRVGRSDWLITNLGTVMIDSLCSLAGFKQFELLSR